jgi:AcrR family transcriptional regulator
MNLVKEKGYSSISIRDLTDRANLGKATFYLHYKDKDELLYECIDMVLSDLVESILKLPPTRWSSNDPRPLAATFEFVDSNAIFIEIMINDPGGLVFFQRLQKLVMGVVLETLQVDVNVHNAKPQVPLELLSTYLAGALLAVIEWWVGNGKTQTVTEIVKMVSMITKLNGNEILGVG